MSLTVTVKPQLDVLPVTSIAVHVTVVTPFGNVLPLAGVHRTVAAPQLSVAVAVYVATAVQRFGAVPVTILGGHEINGGCESVTVTVNPQLAGFPDASVTVQVTVVTPTGNTLALAGTQAGVPTPGQLSLTVGAV